MEVTFIFTFVPVRPQTIYTIIVELTDTVEIIKQKLSELSGYPADCIRMTINNGGLLPDDTLLSDYNTSRGVDVSLW